MARPVSRRAFLGTTAAASAAALISPRLLAAKEAADDAGFAIGVQSFSLRAYSTDEAIKIAGELGFAHIEFYSGQFKTDSTPEEIEAMKQKVASAGMRMLGHGVNKFTADEAKNRQLFEFAKAAGLRNLTADPDPDSFESLDKLVKEFDIRIAIHNHGPRHRYNKAVDVLNACEGHDERIGACADLGHFIRSGEEPTQVIRLLGERLYGIHLKDFAEMQDQTEGVILGRGHLDVDAVFMALKAVSFPSDGCLSIEYEENKEDPVDDLRQCLKVARKGASKATKA